MLQRIRVSLWGTSLLLLLLTEAFAFSASSTNYSANEIEVISGGGVASSTTVYGTHTAIGSGIGTVTQLSSASYSLKAGQLYLFKYFPIPPPKLTVISDLLARTEVLGAEITEKTWQKDNDPYFSWSIDLEPESRVTGFSISMDEQPDFVVDIDSPNYQYADDALSSGAHIFYVLPYIPIEVWDLDDLIQFEIWVDTELPVAGGVSPSAGAIITDPLAAISCSLYDAHSGLNLSQTTLELNGSALSYEYNLDSQQLISQASAQLAEGKNTALLSAVDMVGNSLTKMWEFILDSVGPAGSIAINAGEEVAHSPYVFLNLFAQDETSGVENVFISNDGVFDTEMAHPYKYAPVIYNWVLADMEVDGEKSVYVKFQDSAGNISSAYSDVITLRLLTPDTRLVSGPESITTETSANFAYEATKSDCLFSYKLDEGDWSEWSEEKELSFTGLAEGNHYFYVKAAYDLNGNADISIDEQDPTPAQWVWTVGEEGVLERIRRRILFWRR